jgi:hypothetical protein
MAFVDYDEFERRTLEFKPGLEFFLSDNEIGKSYREYHEREVDGLSLSEERLKSLIASYWIELFNEMSG